MSICGCLLQNVIAEHEIRNISCAAQDPEDLCTFAYITKDLQTSHHYCHVFSTVDVVSGMGLQLRVLGLRERSLFAVSVLEDSFRSPATKCIYFATLLSKRIFVWLHYCHFQC